MTREFKAPEDVHAPRSEWRLRRVVFPGEPDGDHGFSVACGHWKNGDEWEPRLAIRWNANENRPLGSPQSSGHPTWFILPDELAWSVAQRMLRLITDDADAGVLRSWVMDEMKRGDPAMPEGEGGDSA